MYNWNYIYIKATIKNKNMKVKYVKARVVCELSRDMLSEDLKTL